MQSLNASVEIDRQSVESAAQNFVYEQFGLGQLVGREAPRAQYASLARRVAAYTAQHLWLVLTSLAGAIAAAIPLGVIAAKRPGLSQPILSAAEIIQTIPALALLVLLMAPLRAAGLPFIGAAPTIVALFLYSLLPILRNTYTGIRDIPPPLRESAAALGLTAWAQLWRVELPMASRLIMAGVKTMAVINVGYATLGGLIGAGGYGDPILKGLTRLDFLTMLEGAIPAAVLALAVKAVFELSERLIVPKGLRLSSPG
jgi:osmoprotectant transport system permease protein